LEKSYSRFIDYFLLSCFASFLVALRTEINRLRTLTAISLRCV
jgi:hypothetical protein